MKYKIYIVVIALIVALGVIIIYNPQNKDTENKDIIKIAKQTHQYFDDENLKSNYYINSVDELNAFYSLYKTDLDIDKDYLKNYSIFIETVQVGSGSINIKLTDVNFDNNRINFVTKYDVPEVGTMDMSFWYLIAIIPNDSLNGIDISEWVKPSTLYSIK